MKLDRLSRRDRRALWVAATAVAATLLVEFVVLPAHRDHTETAGHLERQTGLLEDDLRLLAEAKVAGSTYRRGARRLLDAAPRTFPAPATGRATRAMIDRLRDLADQSRVFLADVQPTPGERSRGKGVRRLRVSLAAETDFEGLVTWLRTLEVDQRLLVTDSLEIQVPADSTRVRGGGAEVLSVRLHVVGYQLPRGDTLEPMPTEGPASATTPDDAS